MDICKTYIDLESLYSILSNIIENNYSPTDDEKVLLKRFIDKMADSENFALSTNYAFHKYKMLQVSAYNEKLIGREELYIGSDFVLHPRTDNKVNWYLTYKGELVLDELDTKLARKIATDINVAMKILAARNANEQEDSVSPENEEERYTF